MYEKKFGKFISENYSIYDFGHASSVFKEDYENEFEEVIDSLNNFRLKKNHIIRGGGGRSDIPKLLEQPLNEKGWYNKEFKIKILIDNKEKKIDTHEIDCFKNEVGLEIEWNNKTEFYDRDLNNFRILHQYGALSLGIIITRDNSLDEIFKKLKIYDKYGSSTTIISKLLNKINSGALGGCPLLVFGITKKLYINTE
jgi:hypothetical protein